MSESLAERARQAFTDAWAGKIDEAIDPAYHDHDHVPLLPPTREGFEQLRALTLEAFPDFEVTVEDVVASADRAALRITNRGTNTGSFMGNPPTGKRCEWATYAILRLQDGRIIERWGLVDRHGLLSQLGLIG